jgi:transposase
VITDHRVAGWLSVAWEKQGEQTTQDVGRGRGSLSREKRVIQHTRYPITHIARQEDSIAARRQRFGGQAFVTQAGPKRLSLQEAVLAYRHAYRVERIVHRLKSRGHSAPLFVKLNDHIEGLTYLRTLGVRVLTVMAFVLRWSLQNAHAQLPGWHPENKTKMTDTPTAERILQAFVDVALTIIKNAAGEDILRRLTPRSAVQEDILQRLGLGAALYRQLEIQEMGN